MITTSTPNWVLVLIALALASLAYFLAFGGMSKLISLWWGWRRSRLGDKLVDWVEPGERKILDWSFFFFFYAVLLLVTWAVIYHKVDPVGFDNLTIYLNDVYNAQHLPFFLLLALESVAFNMWLLFLFALVVSIGLRRAKARWWIVKFVIIWGAIGVIGHTLLLYFGLLPQLHQFLTSRYLEIGNQKITLANLLRNSFVSVFSFVAIYAAGYMLETYLKRIKGFDKNTRIALIRLLWTLIAITAILTTMSNLGISLSALSVLGGAVGVGIGFGLQKIASNYISGYIILLEKSFRIGDIVRTNDGTTGQVTQIRTRYSVIKSSDGVETMMPNELLITDVVKNLSFSEKNIMLKTEVGASYNNPPALVMQCLLEAAASVPRVVKDPAPAAAILGFGDNAINYRLSFWINDPENGQVSAISAINLAIWESFKLHQVDIPYPQRVVRHVVENEHLPKKSILTELPGSTD